MKISKEKYVACILLHAVGDTIGFKNGDWEFNYNQKFDPNYSTTLLYEFISLGGIIGIDFNGWKVSDDTIMHMDTCYALLETDIKIINSESRQRLPFHIIDPIMSGGQYFHNKQLYKNLKFNIT